MRLFRFNAVGAMGAALQLALLALLVHVGVHYLWATAGSVEAAILHNFIWHRRWTWGDRRGASENPFATLARFNLTSGMVSISGNLLSVYLLTGLLRINPVAANLAAIIVGSLANLFLFDRVVFVPHEKNAPPPETIGR